MKLLTFLCSPKKSIIFRVNLTSCPSKSLETVSAKTNETTPKIIPKGRLIEPNATIKANVKAALNMPMMNERITK